MKAYKALQMPTLYILVKNEDDLLPVDYTERMVLIRQTNANFMYPVTKKRSMTDTETSSV
ncbi:hypothetical protein SAMN05421827_1166 [Pedobacter terrae]|uniref:Uncharacterized protein n=1 Tax=Pedobacter terrae TaxID=405671 RepID=A0A1G7ZE97_9SPHI|nr:hypothetical protein [Pedobacter terrae]SDH06856.1 hypothetical protein SAMN05421827_1166 [Pedobacter terrae]